MEEVYMCDLCEGLYKPRKVFGARKLQTFKGYTVDLWLQQFRKMECEKEPECIEFTSAKGQELLAHMHEEVTR